MGMPARVPVTAGSIRGLKYFELLGPILDRLHPDGTARDRAGNRELFFDQYASLILLYYFTPIITSLRGIREASMLENVRTSWAFGPPPWDRSARRPASSIRISCGPSSANWPGKPSP